MSQRGMFLHRDGLVSLDRTRGRVRRSSVCHKVNFMSHGPRRLTLTPLDRSYMSHIFNACNSSD